MKKEILKFLSLPFCLFIFGGKEAVITFWKAFIQIFVGFFPIFIRQSIEDYLTSPYFIVSIIMLIGSFFGIWFGKKKGKLLYQIVSFIVAILNLASLGVNLI